MDLLEQLYEQKKSASDKKDLRKIRKQIRVELRKRGEYTKQTQFSSVGKKKPELTEEERYFKRERSRKNRKRRAKEASHDARIFWARQKPLHGIVCRCVGCTVKLHDEMKGRSPPLLGFWLILKARGYTQIKKADFSKAYRKIVKGEIPKSDKYKILREIVIASGWH